MVACVAGTSAAKISGGAISSLSAKAWIKIVFCLLGTCFSTSLGEAKHTQETVNDPSVWLSQRGDAAHANVQASAQTRHLQISLSQAREHEAPSTGHMRFANAHDRDTRRVAAQAAPCLARWLSLAQSDPASAPTESEILKSRWMSTDTFGVTPGIESI